MKDLVTYDETQYMSMVLYFRMKVIETFMEAVQTVEPKQAVGKIQNLWIEFAKFYEKHDQLDDARVVFEKAVVVSYVKVEDLSHVWCEYAEMEIRHE